MDGDQHETGLEQCLFFSGGVTTLQPGRLPVHQAQPRARVMTISEQQYRQQVQANCRTGTILLLLLDSFSEEGE